MSNFILCDYFVSAICLRKATQFWLHIHTKKGLETSGLARGKRGVTFLSVSEIIAKEPRQNLTCSSRYLTC